jgi:hypothetical protein
MATSWLRQMGWPRRLVDAIMISLSGPAAGPAHRKAAKFS